MRGPRNIKGRYVRAEDRVTFDYSITFAPAEQGTVWFSRVTSNDTLRGRPSGTFKHPKLQNPAIEAVVRSLVEAAIRDRDGVR